MVEVRVQEGADEATADPTELAAAAATGASVLVVADDAAAQVARRVAVVIDAIRAAR